MPAASWLILHRRRRRWLAMLPLAFIVTAGATGALRMAARAQPAVVLRSE